MKNFFKQVGAVVVGLTIFQVISFVMTLIFLGMLLAAIGSATGDSLGANKEIDLEDNSVLWMDLSYDIPERTTMTSFSISALGELPSELVGLQDLLEAIEHAKNDDKIEGIYIDISTTPNGYATIDALREALLDFKSEGKFITAYGEMITQKAYYLATVADQIYLNPHGVLEMRGIGTRMTFFHKLLTEKLEAEVQVFKVGEFKSAVEPFLLEEASESNERQLKHLLGDIKEDFTAHIATQRDITEEELNKQINALNLIDPDSALYYGLVDGLWYYDEVLQDLVDRTEAESLKELEYVKMSDYALSFDKSNSSSSKIAVIYAEGDIVDGKGEENNIGGAKISRLVRNLRNDEEVKAIVLRVNSGGGSALASEVMWREFELASGDIPFVVSMGDVAASGGYYIACNADKIFAEENTITGSIGVFGLVPSFEKFFNNKLGVTFDDVKLHDHATSDGVTVAFDELEGEMIQKSVEKVYATFTQRVADGRNLPLDTVKKYGEGRIWTGEQGVEIGLVDEIGDLNDAISYAAELAELTEYQKVSYPRIKSPIETLLEDVSGDASTKVFEKELGEFYIYVEQMKRLQEMQKGVQARIPFELEIY